jgi:hypothetical protein
MRCWRDGIAGHRGLWHASAMPRILLHREMDYLRERAREQMQKAQRIQDLCVELRVRLDRQAAELAALGATWRRPPRRIW